MKKFYICTVLLLLGSLMFAQDIKVLEKEGSDEPTTVIFKVDGKEQIPIYRPMGEMNFNMRNEHINIKKLKLIGSAPLTLQLEAGYYTLQLYENEFYTFTIDAHGGTQVWELKSGIKGRMILLPVTGILSGIALTSGFWFFAVDLPHSNPNDTFYDPDVNPWITGSIFIGAAAATVVSGLIYLLGSPSATLVQEY